MSWSRTPGAIGVFDPSSPNNGNWWGLFAAWLTVGLDRRDMCVQRTMTWTHRLRGVDVFTRSHCSKIIESLRID